VAMRLEDRTAIVTGAASGIGEAIARAVAAEGARVVCLDVDEAGVRRVADGLPDGTALTCDVTDYDAVVEAAERAVEAVGRVDVLVHSAGGSRGEATPFLDLEPEIWHRMVDRNLTGAFHCGLVFGRRMAETGGGSVVLISSQLGQVTRPGLAHYSASKGAIGQLVKGMAVDLAPFQIRVNAVAPGPTETPGNAAWFGQPEVEEEHARIIPMGRVARPEEIAGAAVYLASDEASFTTGATIMVDGGYTIV